MKIIRQIWFRWFYRSFMKLVHHYHWHHMRPCYPDGDTLLRCDWCGLCIVTHRFGADDHSIPQLKKSA